MIGFQEFLCKPGLYKNFPLWHQLQTHFLRFYVHIIRYREKLSHFCEWYIDVSREG